MAKQDYQRLRYVAFGNDLLTTCDLDPIYPMLVRADLDEDVLKRWLLAYWCYYAAGPASYVAQQPSDNFYAAMVEGLSWFPRGHERRHFRGSAAIKSITALKNYASPEKVVDYMTYPYTAMGIFNNVQEFYGFGPWISWKIADMTERVLGRSVLFDGLSLFMYKDPVRGAALLHYGDEKHPIDKPTLEGVVSKSITTFRRFLAPPYADRPVNVQEVETILCKWKSHMKGFYPLGNDSFDIAEGLRAYDGDWGDLAYHLFYWLKQSTAYDIGEWSEV